MARFYKPPVNQDFVDYINAVLTQLSVDMARTLELGLNTHYALSVTNSVSTYTIGLIGLLPQNKMTVLKQRGVIETALQVDSSNPAIVSYIGNDVFFTIPKPNVFCESLDYIDLARQRLLPDAGGSLLGVNMSNELVLRNLDYQRLKLKNPHIGTIGASGSGKSNLQQIDLFNLVKAMPPEQLRLIMIETEKGFGEWFQGWEKLPHLACELVRMDETERAIQALTWVSQTSKKRSNQKTDNTPHILVVIDEVKSLYEQCSAMGKKNDNIFSDLLGPLLRATRGKNISFSLATQDETLDGFGTNDIMKNLGLKLSGSSDPRIAKQILDAPKAMSIPMLPYQPGQFLVRTGNSLDFISAPEMRQDFMRTLPQTDDPDYLIDFDGIDSSDIAIAIDDNPCNTHGDWQDLADKPAELVFRGMLLDGAKGSATQATIKRAGLTNNSTEASSLRDKITGLREEFEKALIWVENEVKNDNSGIFSSYNPFPYEITG